MDPLSNQNVLKDQQLQFIVSATDPDHDPLAYTVDFLPQGAILDPATGLFSWTPNSTQTGTYQITFTATDARGLSATATTLISVLNSDTDGLIAHWKFDETAGSIAADSAGSNPGSLVNFNFDSTSGWTAGMIGNALHFDGVNDYVDLDSTELNLTNNFSVSAWVQRLVRQSLGCRERRRAGCDGSERGPDVL